MLKSCIVILERTKIKAKHTKSLSEKIIEILNVQKKNVSLSRLYSEIISPVPNDIGALRARVNPSERRDRGKLN